MSKIETDAMRRINKKRKKRKGSASPERTHGDALREIKRQYWEW